MPLRRITNFMPPPSPVPPRKITTIRNKIATSVDKENLHSNIMAETSTKSLVKPRRISIAVRPPPHATSTTKVIQPKRRVSIATLRPEQSSYMTTPLHPSVSNFQNGSAMGGGRQSLLRDPRKARYSKLFSPLPEFKTATETITATPTAMRSSSKFMGSPPTQAGSWRPKHPTVVALQRKSLVWSPLKLRGMKNARRSLLPSSHPTTEMLQ